MDIIKAILKLLHFLEMSGWTLFSLSRNYDFQNSSTGIRKIGVRESLLV